MLKKFKKSKIPRRKKTKNLTYKDYSRMCKFKFDVEGYPEEFNLDLIREKGWYDNKNNQNGVSRDHMLSISLGWKMDISPKILKHPANCKLMLFQENNKKAWRSSLNIEELMKRIKQWDRKYK